MGSLRNLVIPGLILVLILGVLRTVFPVIGWAFDLALITFAIVCLCRRLRI